jgi:hypothetical protein
MNVGSLGSGQRTKDRQTDRQRASQPCVMGGVVGRVAGNGEELDALGG